MSADLPPLLSYYLGLLGVAEQLLSEDVDEELLLPLAEGPDGRQLLIVRRYGPDIVATAAELLSRQAARLIANGRADVHQSLEDSLGQIAARLQSHGDPELVSLGTAVATAIQAVAKRLVPAPDGGSQDG